LTINLESHHLTNEHKIVACRIAKRVNADYIATADLADLPLLKEYARERIQLTYRAAADILPTALDLTLQAYAAGCGRIESAQAVEILEAWNAPSDSTAAQGHA
jgi:deoxyribose-phosphate aldolase